MASPRFRAGFCTVCNDTTQDSGRIALYFFKERFKRVESKSLLAGSDDILFCSVLLLQDDIERKGVIVPDVRLRIIWNLRTFEFQMNSERSHVIIT